MTAAFCSLPRFIHMINTTFSVSGSITETLGLAFVPQSNLTIQNFQNHFSQNFAVLENVKKIFSESSRILLSTGTKTSLPDSVTRKQFACKSRYLTDYQNCMISNNFLAVELEHKLLEIFLLETRQELTTCFFRICFPYILEDLAVISCQSSPGSCV